MSNSLSVQTACGPAALADTASFAFRDTICTYRRHHGAASAHRWIFGQSSFKSGSCDGFSRPEAQGSAQVMSWPCVQNRCLFLTPLAWTPFADSWALRARVTQTAWALQDLQHCLQTKSGWLPALELGCHDCHSGSCGFWAWLSSWDPGGLPVHEKAGKVSVSCACQN